MAYVGHVRRVDGAATGSLLLADCDACSGGVFAILAVGT